MRRIAMPRSSRYTDHLVNSNIRKWTTRIEKAGAINLAQGLCHVEPFDEKRAAVHAAGEALKKGLDQPGWNSYAHFSGIEQLREQIARKAREFNRLEHATREHVLVTDGASGAFTCAVLGLVEPGAEHEIIVFEPVYTYHTYLLRLVGIQAKGVRLRPPDWSFSRADLESACSSRTRALLLNTPANPSGKVFSRDELAMVASFCIDHDLWAISDEVYEFMSYDGHEHVSLASLPQMWERTVTINSFSKPFSATGWRVGSAVAHTEVLRSLGYVNEYAYVCAPTPLQHGVVAGYQNWQSFLVQRQRYQQKRDILCDALDLARFPHIRPAGSIYVLVDVSRFGLADAVKVNEMLIERVGVGGVPAEDFYSDDAGKQQLRFCFGVETALLHEAARRLKSI
jgi:aminotransferase